MNTNGNTYTVIYSIVLVVLVAAILAFVAMSLQDKQNENVKKETITKVLNAATQTDESLTIDETTDVLKLYSEKITEAFYVDGNGNIAGKMDMGKDDVTKIQVPSTSDLKKQNDILKKIDGTEDEAARAALLESLRLPVFIFDINGRAITVIPCYGAGLWGPIWGYIALAEDGKTIGLHSRCHTYFTPNEGELEDHLKMLLDFFFDTHNAIKENLNQLGNAAVAEEEKKERVKVKGFKAYKENTMPISKNEEEPVKNEA